MIASTFERYTAVNLLTAAYETGRGGPDQRISVIPLDSSGNGFRDALTNQPIEAVFSRKTPKDCRETETNLKMLYDLKKSPDSAVGVWLSGPNSENPKTGKILIAAKTFDPGVVVEYDITGEWFSAGQFQEFSLLLSKYDRGGYFLVNGAWSILPQVIPMPEAWKKILDGRAKIKFNQDVERLLPLVQQNQGEKLLDSVDRLMGANVRMACSAIDMRTETLLVRVRITPDGKELYYVEKCGQCPHIIKDWIPANYVCPSCGGIYKGC